MFSQTIDDMGVLTEADLPALEALCRAYADLRSLYASLDAGDGAMTYEAENRDGDTVLRVKPEVRLIADADRRFAVWCARFGLTPADRSRVSARLAEDGNKFAEFGT